MNVTQSAWQGSLIDAYAHIGDPKYGTVSDVAIFLQRLHIRQAVLVLGPGIPDLRSLMQAQASYGDRIRVMGIPFGANERQRHELGALQIRMGISGMRLMPDELDPNRALIDELGRHGRWLYAINPDQSVPTTRFLLDWLERHPRGQIASPHFLRPERMTERGQARDQFRALLAHPRFHAIFSRHGGNGSAQPYPHPDLRPWVEEMADQVTWERILWGSEFPIIYQRSEQPEAVRDWLLNLGVVVSEEERAAFYAGNAQRLFFDGAPPPAEEVSIPDWVAGQVDPASDVYLFPHNRIFVPMADHGTLLSAYLARSQGDPALTYADFIAEQLSACAQRLRDQADR